MVRVYVMIGVIVCVIVIISLDLYGVISGGHFDCLEFLLQHGADVNVPDIKAQTPLTMAVKNRHIKCVHRLLVAGANPNGDARSLCSPLYIAAMNGFKDILEVINLFYH